MFTALGIYSESFEKPFLEYTSEFYAAEGMKHMQQSDVSEYLKHAEVCILHLLLFVCFVFFNFYFLMNNRSFIEEKKLRTHKRTKSRAHKKGDNLRKRHQI